MTNALSSLHTLVATCVLAALPAALAAEGELPRRPDGKPDLTGTYDTATLTPLVRPAEFGDNLYLSPEQAREIAEREQELLAKGAAPTDPDRDAPPEGGAPPVGLDDSFLHESGAGAVGGYNNFWIDRGSGAFEIDGKFRTSIIFEPENGQLPPWTPQGLRRLGRLRALFGRNTGDAWWLDQEGPGPYDGPETLGLNDRCLLGFGSTSGPPSLPVLYNNFKRIVQTDDRVMILYEMVHDARVIRLDEEHDPEGVAKWLGDAVGHWEGDTLVVHTKNFREQPGLFFASEDLEVTERFTLRPDGDILYRFTVDDPTVWQSEWSGEYPWRRTDDKIFEYACHEGNYAMGNILRGARLLEEEARSGGTSSGE